MSFVWFGLVLIYPAFPLHYTLTSLHGLKVNANILEQEIFLSASSVILCGVALNQKTIFSFFPNQSLCLIMKISHINTVLLITFFDKM